MTKNSPNEGSDDRHRRRACQAEGQECLTFVEVKIFYYAWKMQGWGNEDQHREIQAWKRRKKSIKKEIENKITDTLVLFLL